MKSEDVLPCPQRLYYCDLGKKFDTPGLVIWPLEIVSISNIGLDNASMPYADWRVYVKKEVNGTGYHATWRVCAAHHAEMIRQAEETMRQEVSVYERTTAYHDRGYPW